jgi:hypothetical protein
MPDLLAQLLPVGLTENRQIALQLGSQQRELALRQQSALQFELGACQFSSRSRDSSGVSLPTGRIRLSLASKYTLRLTCSSIMPSPFR